MNLAKAKTTVALLVIGLLIIFPTILVLTNHLWSPQAIKGPDGLVVRLDGWHFEKGPVRYDLPYRPLAQRLDKLLPAWANRYLGLTKPIVTSYAEPNFAGEPFLSAAFSIHQSDGGQNHSIGGLRIIARDENGQEFDPAVHDSNVQKRAGSAYWATGIDVFPRRGSELRLRLMDNTEALGEIKIPNPARGPYPRWKAQPLPVTAEDGEVKFSLVKFRSFQSGAATFTRDGIYPRTQCAFRVSENGLSSTTWQPVSFEISDATGNHWQPFPDPRLGGRQGEEVLAGFLGALWPDEDAWKLRVEFKRIGDFPDNELLRLEHLPVPGAEEIRQPQMTCETNGAWLEKITIIGARTAWNRVVWLNPDRGRDCCTVLINGKILSQGRRLVFISANDDHGARLTLEGSSNEPGQLAMQTPDFLPYSFNFKPPQDARELTLVLAVTRSRLTEFVAKPEQVRDDGAGAGR